MAELKKDYFKFHKVHKSVFNLAWPIISLEILTLVIKYAVSLIFIKNGDTSLFTYIFFIISFLSFLLSICILFNWLYHYYILTRDDISINTGFLYRKTKTFDFNSIKSIRVKQGIIGKIFNYGTIELDIPDVKKMPILYSIPDPFGHAKILEEQRLKEDREHTITPAVEIKQ